MISNGRGQLNATDLLYKLLKARAVPAFNALAAQATTDAPAYWRGWSPASAVPRVIKVSDGPLDEIQPVHPALVITPEGGSRDYPMATYDFTVSYTYACPKMLEAVDLPLLSCQLAQEALLDVFKGAGSLLSGIGWTFSNWTLSTLRDSNAPAPLYSRTLDVTITLQIEEDY